MQKYEMSGGTIENSKKQVKEIPSPVCIQLLESRIGRVTADFGPVTRYIGHVTAGFGRATRYIGRVTADFGRAAVDFGRVTTDFGRDDSYMVLFKKCDT